MKDSKKNCINNKKLTKNLLKNRICQMCLCFRPKEVIKEKYDCCAYEYHNNMDGKYNKLPKIITCEKWLKIGK